MQRKLQHERVCLFCLLYLGLNAMVISPNVHMSMLQILLDLCMLHFTDLCVSYNLWALFSNNCTLPQALAALARQVVFSTHVPIWESQRKSSGFGIARHPLFQGRTNRQRCFLSDHPSKAHFTSLAPAAFGNHPRRLRRLLLTLLRLCSLLSDRDAGNNFWLLSPATCSAQNSGWLPWEWPMRPFATPMHLQIVLQLGPH